MKIIDQKTTKKLEPVIDFISRHKLTLAIIFLLGLYGLSIYKIGYYIQSEPTEAELTSNIEPLKQLQIDDEAVSRMQQLEQQNIEIQSLFNDARNNPFDE